MVEVVGSIPIAATKLVPRKGLEPPTVLPPLGPAKGVYVPVPYKGGELAERGGIRTLVASACFGSRTSHVPYKGVTPESDGLLIRRSASRLGSSCCRDTCLYKAEKEGFEPSIRVLLHDKA